MTLLLAGIPMTSVMAEELAKETTETLDPTVVTATRSPESITDTPYTASVVDRKDLDDHLIRSIPDAFVAVPGVLIQKTAHGHGSPYIRGFTGRQNLLLVDGIRMNNSTWRSGPVQYWNTFDQENLQSIELIKGQGSVLYGSDAIGGTANLISRSSGFMDQSGFFSQGRSHYRFDTNSESHVGRLEANIGEGGKWGLTLGLTGKDFGDIRDDAVGRMKRTGYSEEAFDLKFETAISDSAILTLAHQYLNQDDIYRWHRTIYNPGWVHEGEQLIGDQSTSGAKAEIYDQERSLTYARLAGSVDGSFIDNYSVTLSYQKTQDSTYRDRTNTGGNIDTKVIDLETYGFDLQLESKVGPGSLIYGLDYYRDEADASAARNGTFRPSSRPVADDSTYDLLGAFAQYQWEATDALKVTAGARYSYAEAEWEGYRPSGASEDQSGDNHWDDLSLSLRAMYDLSNSWSVYGGVSQAFRAPNLNDLTGSTYSLNGINSSGSVDVDPEEYINYELGLRYASENTTFGVAAYYNDIEDQIAGVDDGMGGSTATNAGEGYIFGVEVDGAYRFAENWEARAWAAWQDGKAEYPSVINGPMEEDTIRRMHPFMGGASLRWTRTDDRLWIESRVKGAATVTNVNASTKASGNDNTRVPTSDTPSYFIVSLYSGYQVNENLELTLGLENLLDDDYRYHGAGQNEPGLNAILGVTMTW
ncbi:hemoglobin/transferrin/lactoferrin receptor protein [Rubritalea squalenifaciens DSM 18772]|uniref:Hemoglobin/transferrin/lactoferrin receptor protein n=1 Tax=Rubritalea squalenifaciens DSM 18772 TaxID=1123071 RepID=A0A1M6BCV1_9BACT|nr:TonB-dependent receptor [Rubritalea squalenifaciens]SHI46283.1 hemoglobin/transferrin/lactoferrin receptor protein [Rubritalea squalenifaciens DSM 18772]